MSRRILIIDDEPHICEGLKDRLETMGYDVVIAHDGRTGLALIALESKHVPIQGVLLDVQMPVMNGMEVLREVRARHPGIPILMMSAGLDRRVLDEAVQLGAKNYLMKPFESASLKRLLEQVFPLEDARA